MKLKYKCVVYVPSIKKTGAHINDGIRDFIARDIAGVLTDMHGGCTVSNSIGYHKKTNTIEKISKLESWSTKRIDRKKIVSLAKYVLDQCEQDSVMLECNGIAEIIGGAL